MNINEFVKQFNNHPVLFIGTGMSLRYLNNSYTWDGLLKKISYDISGSNEAYYDIKSKCSKNGGYQYEKVAALLEEKFNQYLIDNRDGEFKNINDKFYENMDKDINISRFKLYISDIFSKLEFKDEMQDEIAEFKKVRKNIGSVITTNYDKVIEEIFEFNPLIGNDILLSNPYGSLYKIHGCTSQPDKIVITTEDYDYFDKKYELIRAQLLSLFIHNPIIFIGYNVGDDNIKSILKTIFTYVEPNSEEAKKIKSNFLLVEYDKGSTNEEISDHDIELEGSLITINKLKTDNYTALYKALSELQLPVSAMDIRKVQNVVKEIYSGGDIKVTITEDPDTLKNSDKILAIGSSKTITYQYLSPTELMSNYFKIIDESNKQILVLIDKSRIQSNQWFSMYGFAEINADIKRTDKLKLQQETMLETLVQKTETHGNVFKTINDVEVSEKIVKSKQVDVIVYSIMNGDILLDSVESYLRAYEDKNTTEYRKILCAYDYMKYK